MQRKTSPGEGAGTQVLATDYSAAAAAAVMNRLAKLSARFIGERGFSIGIDDVMPAPVLQRRKQQIIAQSYALCEARASAPGAAQLLAPLGALSAHCMLSARRCSKAVMLSCQVCGAAAAWRVGRARSTCARAPPAGACNPACLRERSASVAGRQDHIAAFKAGKLELVPGCNLEESLESHVMGVLNRIRNEASEARLRAPPAMRILSAWP